LLINDQLLILDDQSRNNKVRVHYYFLRTFWNPT
jgi:hypothetical protein